MENTNIIFDNSKPKYYLFKYSKILGPYTAQEIYTQIKSGELSLLDFIWKEGLNDFIKICDDETFSSLIPQKPDAKLLNELQEKLKQKQSAPPPPIETEEPEVTYYLYFQKTQYGPFSQKEIEKLIHSKKINSATYIWTSNWKNWKKISDVEPFNKMIDETKPTTDSSKSNQNTKKEKRESPRKPLVARLFVTNDDDVSIAVCRDISIGGMQVLTDKIPGQVGDKIKLNVAPSDQKVVKSFVAEGEIVRILEDGRGFSFRFIKLSPDAKKAIKEYIEG
jgi:hypothetical protein